MSSEQPVDFPFQHVAVLGPGLIGGSILLKLASLPEGQRPKLSVWARRVKALYEIAEVIPEINYDLDGELVIAGADLIILASPIIHMFELAKKIQSSGQLNPDAIITDVGSVKGETALELREIFQTNQGASSLFLGSHPMAGSEKTGFKAATSDLFTGSSCFIANEGGEKQKQLKEFWKRLGCQNVVASSYSQHDKSVAEISHLPHLAAAAATNSILSKDTDYANSVGGGFRDFTRIAAGDPELWMDILIQNKKEVIHSLKDYIAELTTQLGHLENGDEKAIFESLAKAQKLRQSLDQ